MFFFLYLLWEHRASEYVLHLTRFAAVDLASFHVVYACASSLSIVRLQVFFGRSFLRLPCGFHSSASRGNDASGFLCVWPIHLHFLLFMTVSSGSSSALAWSSSLDILFRIEYPMNSSQTAVHENLRFRDLTHHYSPRLAAVQEYRQDTCVENSHFRPNVECVCIPYVAEPAIDGPCFRDSAMDVLRCSAVC